MSYFSPDLFPAPHPLPGSQGFACALAPLGPAAKVVQVSEPQETFRILGLMKSEEMGVWGAGDQRHLYLSSASQTSVVPLITPKP